MLMMLQVSILLTASCCEHVTLRFCELSVTALLFARYIFAVMFALLLAHTCALKFLLFFAECLTINFPMYYLVY